MDLAGRVAVVTGAGRGIGREVALMLAAHGAKVVVNDLGVSLSGDAPDSKPTNGVVDEIVAAGGTAVANGDDISKHTSAERLIQQAVDTYGSLDILVNVAGILRPGMIFNLAEEDWDAVINVHLKGTYNTTKFAARHWRGLRNPDAHHRLINFTSGAGLNGAPSQPNYAAAKMGIVGLTYSCANALGKYGVTSNAISPAAHTRMIDSVEGHELASAGKELSEDENPMAPKHVAKVVTYVASPQSAWLNGRIIRSEGFKVSLVSNPELIRQIVSERAWDVGNLGALMEESFRPIVERPAGKTWAVRQPASKPAGA